MRAGISRDEETLVALFQRASFPTLTNSFDSYHGER